MYRHQFNHQRSENSQRQDKDFNSRELKLQDVFLNYCRRERVQVSVLLLDHNVKQGQLVGFDGHSLILEISGRQHLIYKSAVVAIDPQEQFNYIFNDAYRADELKTYADLNLPVYADPERDLAAEFS